MTTTSWACCDRTSYVYIDTVLMWLKTVPKTFKAVVGGLQWVAKARGVSYLKHFLDDYITVGAPHSSECDCNLLALVIDTGSVPSNAKGPPPA